MASLLILQVLTKFQHLHKKKPKKQNTPNQQTTAGSNFLPLSECGNPPSKTLLTCDKTFFQWPKIFQSLFSKAFNGNLMISRTRAEHCIFLARRKLVFHVITLCLLLPWDIPRQRAAPSLLLILCSIFDGFNFLSLEGLCDQIEGIPIIKH